MTIRPLVPQPIVFVVASAAVFLIALVVVPPFGVTFDEAKYLGIGYSVIEGQGPQIVFGGYFLPHAPVWPTVVVAPAVALGIDPLIVGRILNALAGLGLILLGARLAWRVSPRAAAFAAIALLATNYLHELTRTARLDVPAATLAVAYLALGLVAVRRGSVPLSIVAGLLFALAFLVKEIVLPLAPVPVLAAILHRQPWRPLLRSAGWLTLAATVGVAPWFIFVAEVAQRVYRLGTPAWTLLPLGLAVLGIGAAGIVAGWLRAPDAVTRLEARLDGRGRTWLVIAITLIWVLAMTLLFTGTLRSRGTLLIDIPQIARYVREWYPYLVTSALGAVGLALSVLAWRDADPARREAIEDLWLATICGLPLVILVIGVGEAPRNYLAQIAIGAGVGAAGWLWVVDIAIRRWLGFTILASGALFGSVLGLVVGGAAGVSYRRGAVAGLIAGLLVGAAIAAAQRSGRFDRRWVTDHAVVGLMVLGLIGASGVLAFTISSRPPTTYREQAVDAMVSWARQNIPPGSTIAFGSYLSYEMALPLRRDYTVRQVRHVIAIADIGAPDGITVFGKPATDDWVAVDIAPRNVNEFQAFSAGTLIAQLQRSGADFWAYTTGSTTSAPTIIPALQGAAGFEQVAHWSVARARGEPIETFVYRLDLASLTLEPGRLMMAPDALERIVALIERKSATALAQRIAPQVEVTPRTAESDVLLERLRQMAQP